MSDIEREVERLSDLIVPYICERTNLSREQVEQMLDAQEDFWEHQPHVIGRMFILGFELGGEELDAG